MSQFQDDLPPYEIADKVLRRARVSKMTRALQDGLALAHIKINRGWQHRNLDSIEPELEQELKRKRELSNTDGFSDTSSSVFSSALPASSPVTAPIFSDEVPRSGSSQGSLKRLRPNVNKSRRTSGVHTRLRSHRAQNSTASWKSAHQLPESSPTFRHSFNAPAHPIPQPSFLSETSTVVDSASVSEDDDQDIPLYSFQTSEIQLTSSPPRTPPPEPNRSARLQASSFTTPKSSHTVQGTKEGADLLMFLASSPSPAARLDRTPGMQPPATPPSKQTPLPSSMMSTPGGQAMLFGYNPHTPSANFNFADFVNVTPSPAQVAFNKTPKKTPGGLKTPIAARETRRRLNFGASPNIGEHSPGKREGLGMDLGAGFHG